MASNNFYDSDSDDFGTRPPFFDGEEYYIWKNRMQVFVRAVDFHAGRAIQNGPFIPTHIVDGLTKEKPRSEWTDDDEKKVHADSRAKHFIFCALSNNQLSYVMNCDTAQEMWNTLRDIHEGTGKVKMARIEYLTGKYEVFSMKPGENIRDMQMRFYDVVDHLDSLGKKIPDEELVNKVLRCLSKKWRHKVRSIRKSNDLSTMLLVSLFSEIQEHELELNRLDENDEMHKKKKNSARVAASSRKKYNEDVDRDDSKRMEIKDFLKLLEKKTPRHQGKKGSSSYRTP
ncbi:uncharacterized protein LOC123881543 [Trifolium pratense]|uniref:uncharacterized protein LOC123881543 n=1 Tax=Trifolium pratense TaxID=57577 RepID=UPI001E697E66|nr:uncharacterized protein LOC123881543 [Trifolium pratense]XP_045786209.1 uncharacterized protein LOC123881543 [Trifolium pratense]XP_045786210.1 uncharacterized protein LOC123881543 [Trifolium pratense]